MTQSGYKPRLRGIHFSDLIAFAENHIDVALGPSFNSAIRLKPSFSYIPGAWKSWLVTQIRRTDMRNQLMPFLYDCGWQMT